MTNFRVDSSNGVCRDGESGEMAKRSKVIVVFSNKLRKNGEVICSYGLCGLALRGH